MNDMRTQSPPESGTTCCLFGPQSRQQSTVDVTSIKEEPVNKRITHPASAVPTTLRGPRGERLICRTATLPLFSS